jgi:hypothetical protein
MKKMIFPVFIISLQLYAQQQPNNFYLWHTMNDDQKTFLIKGIVDGYNYLKNIENEKINDVGFTISFMYHHRHISKPNLLNFIKKDSLKDVVKTYFIAQSLIEIYGTKATIGQYVCGIDDLYHNFMNHNITVEKLILIIDFKFNGEDKEEIEERLQKLRK